ncbi:MAG: hypothetical protein ACREIB_12345, partial [Pseudomonadota bacterium]
MAGGGAVVVPVYQGDVATLIDREGRQRCEIAALAPDGREDTAALGLTATVDSPGINKLLAGNGEEARQIGAA